MLTEFIMKIYSISRIKNEEDIIESFIRYHLNFLDGMIIIEDYSNDETYNILQKLKDENLPIHIYRNSKTPIPQQEVINNAYNIALNDFNADIVVPLDGDEFLVCKDGGNPRNVLEKLPQDKYYNVFWRTYLPSLNDKSFSLNKLKMIRDPVLDDRSKIIVPSKLTQEYEIILTPGSHSLENKDIPFEELDDLRIAHIPIRNKQQCISKEVIGWLNNISHYYKDPRSSWHQNIMYQMLIESNGNLTDEQVIKYAKSYSSRRISEDNIDEFEHPFDISFCENIDLKYTCEYDEHAFVNILEFAENLALDCGNANQKLNDMNEDIISKYDNDLNYLYTLEDAYTHVKKQLYFKENELVIKGKNYTGKIELKNYRISELKDKVSEKNEKIAELKKKVSQKNDRIKELKEKHSDKNQRIKNLLDENKALKKENKRLNKINKDIFNSRSWKITKPLRRS